MDSRIPKYIHVHNYATCVLLDHQFVIVLQGYILISRPLEWWKPELMQGAHTHNESFARSFDSNPVTELSPHINSDLIMTHALLNDLPYLYIARPFVRSHGHL